MSETEEKDLSEVKQNADPLPEAGPPEPEQEQGHDPEDDNLSWEDAFKEEEAAKAAAKPDAGRDGVNQDVMNDLDLNIDDLKNKIEINDAEPAEAETPSVSAVKKPVKKLEFASFDESDKTAEAPKNLDFILDIPLTISVELGRTKMVINDMLQLGQGSVIELAKLAGEPLDIYVNGKLMARGEVVLVNDKFGVRLTDIISPVERVKKL
ncbi:MAG: flagellar motor switch protein FliN [bacterium]